MMEVTATSGEKLILLTEAEYHALIGDAGDAALARASIGAPTLPADLALRVADGDMHPLTAWRKAANLTMVELAAKVGMRVATVSDIENGRIDPQYSTVKAIAEALGLSPDDIMP